MAVAFAAALLCKEGGCGTCHSCTLAMSGNHPDINLLTTEKVGISIEEVRNLVVSAQMGGSMGRYRIMIIEDADRMAERSSNVLLKALEEPPAGTVWILCAPSEADMLPTIRSRCRKLLLAPLSDQDMFAVLDGLNLGLPEAELRQAIGLAGGSVRRALTRLDPETMALIDAVLARINAINAAQPAADPKASPLAASTYGSG
jgi:DNA polymerase-3 subunit delta'